MLKDQQDLLAGFKAAAVEYLLSPTKWKAVDRKTWQMWTISAAQ
jgi:hypothetical protein